jgi:hypothetical protein
MRLERRSNQDARPLKMIGSIARSRLEKQLAVCRRRIRDLWLKQQEVSAPPGS